MNYFQEIYADLTPSKRDFVNNVIGKADGYKNSGKETAGLLREFADNVKTGGDWDAKNRTNNNALIKGKISNEYLGILLIV